MTSFTLGNGAIWNGDCLELMKYIPSGSVDMILTSPPYDNLRTYNDSLEWSFDIFRIIAKELSRIIKEGGVIVWNVADATVKGSETGSSFRQALYFKDECGLNLHDTMIWQKPQIAPLTHNRYEQAFEYMFIFTKGKLSTFNAIKDKENIGFGRKITGKRREKDGKTYEMSGKISNKTIAEFGIRYNVWLMDTTKGKGNIHPATFPVQLANDHILTWSNPGNVILDPFSGSGTTAIAAQRTGRRFICIEKDPVYYYGSTARLWKELNT